MKLSNILNLVLAAALVFVCARMALAGDKNDNNTMNNAVINNIMTRASVRSYTQQPVEDEKVEALLRAGMAAPTAVNKQPWHFIVVNDKATLGKIAELTPNAGMAAQAPLAIVVCGDMTKTLDGVARDFWVQDASAATENILLAAHGMGLGGVWTGLYPDLERSKKIAGLLQTPDNIVPMCTLVIGYPDGEVQPKDKWNAANVSYNTFGGKNGDAPAATVEDETPKTFKEFDVTKDFRENGFNYFMKNHGLLLAAGDKSSSNAMTIGWGGIGKLWQKNVVTVYVAKGRYTHEFMERTKYFTVMEFKDPEVGKYMGSHSGRDGDKAEALGLHTAYTENGTPYYEEADVVIECRLMYKDAFSPEGFTDDVPRQFYNGFEAGLHSEYIGEVVKAMKKQ